ncbi:MAG: ABC transporter permease subunit [Ruminococcus flavefaciens]|nr:ABC transporter permease subunit [Eubacterium sp.]MCM1235187.1 ABC transporter permease subunit [Ruminococcus flavefaciens]
MGKEKKKNRGFRPGYDIKTQLQLHTLMLPGTLMMLIFSIVPLFGLILAFKNYKVVEGIRGVFTSPWYGLQNFKVIFGNFDFKRMLGNTLGINLIGNVVGILAAITFALFINEITRPRFKSVVQTVTYMPHFISWVVYGGIVITMLSADGGMLNQILMKIGVLKEPVVFMAEPKYFWTIAIVSNLIKEVGWSTILYSAAIAGVDQELYEAADLDGASRLQKMRYVTMPSIKGTVVIMIIFAVAGIMNNSFDQIYVLQNSFNLERSEVIDTYIYKVGLQQLQFGMAAAVNIFKSILAIMLLSIANFVSGKLTDSGLF